MNNDQTCDIPECGIVLSTSRPYGDYCFTHQVAAENEGDETVDEKRANDRQEGGDHYTNADPQPWDVIAGWGLDYWSGNVVNYIARSGLLEERQDNRGGVSDLKKARHYLDKAIEMRDRQPAECLSCGRPAPQAHAPGCPYAFAVKAPRDGD